MGRDPDRGGGSAGADRAEPLAAHRAAVQAV